MEFKTGDRVRVKERTDTYCGITGTVIDANGEAVYIKFDLPFVIQYDTHTTILYEALFHAESLDLLGQTTSNKEWEDLWGSGEDDG